MNPDNQKNLIDSLEGFVPQDEFETDVLNHPCQRDEQSRIVLINLHRRSTACIERCRNLVQNLESKVA